MTESILIPILLVFILQTGVFFWYLAIRNPTVVDVGWAGTTVFVAMFAVFMRPYAHPVGFLMSALILLWGLRLGSYLLLTRILKRKIDRRYLELARNARSQALYFFQNFQLQGLLIYILTMPLHVLPSSIYVTAQTLTGVVFCFIGLLMESLADYQLFRYQHTEKGGVCRDGLWAYSRHPNYFGDWLFWVGIANIGSSQAGAYTWLSWLSPLTLYLIMTQVTGPLTERLSLEKRPVHYTKYQQEVPMFLPNLLGMLRDAGHAIKALLKRR